MKVGWWQVLLLGGSSGVLAGLVNQGAGFVRDLLAGKAHAVELERDREHQRALRREEAHAAARETYLGYVAQAIDHVQAAFFREFGSTVGMQMLSFPVPEVQDITEILAGLRKIAREHPSADVRELANDVFGDLINYYNDPIEAHGGPSERVLDAYDRWLTKLSDLLDRIHLPDHPFPAQDQLMGRGR